MLIYSHRGECFVMITFIKDTLYSNTTTDFFLCMQIYSHICTCMKELNNGLKYFIRVPSFSI